jgi:hypothetical protein
MATSLGPIRTRYLGRNSPCHGLLYRVLCYSVVLLFPGASFGGHSPLATYSCEYRDTSRPRCSKDVPLTSRPTPLSLHGHPCPPLQNQAQPTTSSPGPGCGYFPDTSPLSPHGQPMAWRTAPPATLQPCSLPLSDRLDPACANEPVDILLLLQSCR